MDKQQIVTVLFTATAAPERKTNSKGSPYALARGTMKSGNAVTVLTYQPEMVALIADMKIGDTVKVRGVFNRSNGARTFAPLYRWTEKAAPAAAAA